MIMMLASSILSDIVNAVLTVQCLTKQGDFIINQIAKELDLTFKRRTRFMLTQAAAPLASRLRKGKDPF